MDDKIIEMYVSDVQGVYYAITNKEVIVLVPNENKTYALGPVGTRIWELADGAHKIKEVIDILCAEFAADRNTIAKDAIKFISNLSKKHLLVLSKKRQRLSK